MGRKKRPYYRIIAIDSRRPRDGAFIERLGYYHPLADPPAVKVDADKALKWLRVGAQPSNTVLSLLRREGVWLRWRLEKSGKSEDQINAAMTQWFETHAPVQPVEEKVEEPAEAKPEAKAATTEVVEAKSEAKVDSEPPKEEVPAKEAKAEEKATPPKAEVKAEPSEEGAAKSADAKKAESSESSTEAKDEKASD